MLGLYFWQMKDIIKQTLSKQPYQQIPHALPLQKTALPQKNEWKNKAW